MENDRITEYTFSKECEALAKDIFDDIMSDPLADVESGNLDDCDPEDWLDDMIDRAHETADGHQWIIYHYRAHQICAECNTDQGEQFLEDCGMPETPTYDSLATAIAYGEMRARIEIKLQEICEAWEPVDA